jgi:PAS domain-containing protein
VLDGLPTAAAVQRGDGRVLFVSERFVDLFGYTHEDVPHLDEWWPRAYPDPEHRAAVQQTWGDKVAEATRTGAPIRPLEYDVTCKDGMVRRIEFMLATIDGDLGLVLFNDVTRTRVAERALRDQVNFSNAVIEKAADGICVCHNTDIEPFVRFGWIFAMDACVSRGFTHLASV